MNTAMRKILFVDDDPVVLTLYRNRLQRNGFQIEVAQDGQEALNMLPEVKPDLVVLDLMLPEVNGVEVLKFIRSHADLKSIPVLVLSNAFLTELANKAMKAGANKGILKSECNPAKLVGMIHDMLGGAPAPEPAIGQTKFYSGKSQAQAYLAAAAVAQADEISLKTARAEFLKQAANEIAAIREHCLVYIKNCNSPAGKQHLSTLFQRVHFLSGRASLAGCARIALLASAFEALLFDIVFRPVNATPSVMQTIAQAVDALGRLFQQGDLETAGLNLNAKVLVVDDDAVCNRTVVSALRRAHLDPVSTEDPKVALQLLESGCFDIVLIDINMPQMNGFELCEALRRLPHYRTTPVIFIAENGDFQNRARSVLSGGDDLITKPTSPLELVLKTTMYLLHAHSVNGSGEQKNIVRDEILLSEALRVGLESSTNESKNTVTNITPSSAGEPATEPVLSDNSGDIFKRTPPVAKTVTPEYQSSSTLNDAVEVPQTVVVTNDATDISEGLIGFDEPVFARDLEPSQSTMQSAPTAGITETCSAPKHQPSSSSTPHSANTSQKQNTLSRKSSLQPAMQNKYSQAFDEISHEVARIIFGEENLTELNVRLARIALERYNVHEILNRLADANDAHGHASRLSAVAV